MYSIAIGNIMQNVNRRELLSLTVKGLLGCIAVHPFNTYATIRQKAGAINVMEFGAIGDGKNDDSLAFQNAISAAHQTGTGRVYIPKPVVEYLIKFPVFIQSNTEVYGEGESSKIVFENPVFSKGRGGFVIGSSLEANRELGFEHYKNRNISSTINNHFQNPTQRQYLRDNPSFIQAEKCIIHDLYLEARFTPNSESNWGGYGINFVNAQDCHAYNIWGKGWTQLIGMGSDTPPETPSNHNCTAQNLYVLEPDLVRTYYSIGFIANSTNCSIQNAKQFVAMTDGSSNGSGVALNFCEDCIISNIEIPNLGRTQTSEGVLINNSSGCIVQNINIGNAKKAVSLFYKQSKSHEKTKPNIIKNIKGIDCDIVLSVYSKLNIIKNITGEKCKRIIALMNTNAAKNEIHSPEVDISTPGKTPLNTLMKLNKIAN